MEARSLSILYILPLLIADACNILKIFQYLVLLCFQLNRTPQSPRLRWCNPLLALSFPSHVSIITAPLRSGGNAQTLDDWTFEEDASTAKNDTGEGCYISVCN
jgi:hypothetical protein